MARRQNRRRVQSVRKGSMFAHVFTLGQVRRDFTRAVNEYSYCLEMNNMTFTKAQSHVITLL